MYIYCNKIPKEIKVFLHVQTDYLWTIDLVKINIYRFHKIIHTCGIPMVPILQIWTQIPLIQISSLGYQLSQLFKILTYTELQDTGLWCRLEGL